MAVGGACFQREICRHIHSSNYFPAVKKPFCFRTVMFASACACLQRPLHPKSVLQTPPETCSKSDSVLGPVKDAFKVAEQSAYEYFSHFSEGLREDVREVSPPPTPIVLQYEHHAFCCPCLFPFLRVCVCSIHFQCCALCSLFGCFVRQGLCVPHVAV